MILIFVYCGDLPNCISLAVTQIFPVRPGPAEEVNLTGDTQGSLTLTYSTPRELTNFPAGLDQVVTIKNEYQMGEVVITADWDQELQVYNVTIPEEEEEEEMMMNVTMSWDRKRKRFSVIMDQLCAWTNYSLGVRMISARADKSEERLWSRPVSLSRRTLPTSPDFPPGTAGGSFQVVRDSSQARTVWLYWRQEEPRHHNGPGFNYSARVLTQPQLSPVLITSSFAQFPGLPTDSGLNFSVSSYNDEGTASQSSRVFVPRQEVVETSAPTSVTTIYSSEDESYKVSWFLPSTPVSSFTIFWCETETSLPFQCSGQASLSSAFKNIFFD